MKKMEEIQRKLHQAAVEGSVTAFLRLLEEDELAVERYAAGCFMETPLHIAAMLGHLEFTIAILSRKPELANELDFRRWSPLHLASANGHLQVVKTLLLVNPDMCLAQDRDGWSPLHVAVIKGRVEVLQELVRAKPEAVRLPGKRGETILHLCVKHYQLETLKFLVGAIDDYGFVNAKDHDGFNVLHLAVAYRKIEIIDLISKTTIEVNALNSNGFTALDIALAHGRENEKDIQDYLRQVGAVSVKTRCRTGHDLEEVRAGTSFSNVDVPFRTLPYRVKNSKKCHERNGSGSLEKTRETLTVVASLIATMAFQAVTNPPGGVWQDDPQEPVSKSRDAGRSIMAYKYPTSYTIFVACTTVSFLSSLTVILILISGIRFKRRFLKWFLMMIMWVAVTSTMYSYSVSLYRMSGNDGSSYAMAVIIFYTLCGIVGILLSAHFFRLIRKIFKFARRLLRKHGHSRSVIPDLEHGPEIINF